MGKHSYGGNPKPPPAARDAFSNSTTPTSHTMTTSKPTNNHGGNSGWFDGFSKPYTPSTPPRKLGSW